MAQVAHKNEIFLDWAWYQRAIKLLVKEAKRQKIQYIVGISRGGLIPAVHLSNILNIPMGIMAVRSYHEHAKQGQMQYLGDILDYQFVDKKVWVIDDIKDTGKTEKFVKAKLELRMFNPKKLKFVYMTKAENPNVVSFPWFEE